MRSLVNALTLAAGVAATVATIAATPASAVLLRFCGVFADDAGNPIPGAKIDGEINVAPDGTYLPSAGNFFATTYAAGMTDQRIYDPFDFVGSVSDPLGENLLTYQFAYNKAFPPSPNFDNNSLYIRIPNPLPDTGQTVDGFNFETRNAVRRIDPEKWTNVPVPGPLPLLGAAAAFGWSRRLRKRIDTTGSIASSIAD